MKTTFIGSSEFSSIILEALQRRDIEIPLVITRTPKEKGRGKKKYPTPVGKKSRELSLNLIETDNPNKEEVIHAIKETGVDIFFLASYGAILEKELLEAVKYPLNIHPSLLPAYRGCAPVRRALMDGQDKTGITIFKMDEGIDTGDIIKKKEVIIEEGEVATELKKRLALDSIDIVLEVLKEYEKEGTLKVRPQNNSKASYAYSIKKDELEIDWNSKCEVIEGKIRGLSYTPGAYTEFRRKRLKIFRARANKDNKKRGSPGEIIGLNDVIEVACGKNSLLVKELQLAGRKKMESKSFINGYHLKTGEMLG